MLHQTDREIIDPELTEGWLRARSLARGLPQPVPDQGGLRLDTGLPHEYRRYLFCRPASGLRDLAESIVEPRVFLKLCGAAEAMTALLPPRWTVKPPSWVMNGPAQAPEREPAAPDGYVLRLSTEGAVTTAQILADGQVVAASGRAAEAFGVFIYDQISTDPAHRRRGLGRAIMQALGSRRSNPDTRQVLVATEEGRALYQTLGWRVCCPYMTAVIPG